MRENFYRWLSPPALLTAAAVAVISGDLCGEAAWGGNQPVALAFMALGAVLALMGMMGAREEASTQASARRGILRWVLWGVIAVHAAAAVAYCRMNPAENIDTWTFQTEAARRLVHGIDPYGGTEANPYTPEQTAKFYGPDTVRDGRVQVGLQYPPLTALWVLPGYLVGDIRLSYVLAVALAAVLLFEIAPNAWGLGLSFLLLADPFTLIVENRCWTEPLPLLLVAGTVWAMLRKRVWVPVMLGLLLAAKQYDVLALALVPVICESRGLRQIIRLAAGSLGVAAITYLPFAVWNWRALLHDLVQFHLGQPMRADSISFAVLSPLFLHIGPWLLLGFLVWAALRLRGAAMFAAALGMAVLLMFATGKQAFANYFFLIAGCWMSAAAALRAPVSQHSVRH